MTTLKQLNVLATAQENGATLEGIDRVDKQWVVLDALDKCDLFFVDYVSIKQPEIDRTDLEWCGYAVPDKSNCYTYLDYDGSFSTRYPDKGINNGYRHLYRRKKPKTEYNPNCKKCHGTGLVQQGRFDPPEECDCSQDRQPKVVPYTLETLPVDRPSWVKSKTANTRPTIEYADESGVTILRTHHTYAEAMNIVDWPDGTPFGVEVMG